MQKEGIVFEPSTPYSQEQNGVAEQTGRTLMDMTRATILEGNIDNELWPEVILLMTCIKNNRPTRTLCANATPQEAQDTRAPNLFHVCVLGSTVYVFLHEEERARKSEKWAPRAFKSTLVGYDGDTIYRVFIREQNKVIRVKDLRIFEDYETKTFTALPDYNGRPTFEGFLIGNEEKSEGEKPQLQTASSRASRKVETKNAMKAASFRASQRAETENAEEPTTQMSKESRVALSQSGRKVDDNEAKEPTVAPTRSGRKVGKD